jgi:hypothetical protein
MQTSDAPASRMLVNRAGFTPKVPPAGWRGRRSPYGQTTGTGAQKYENDQTSTLHAAHFPQAKTADREVACQMRARLNGDQWGCPDLTDRADGSVRLPA